MYFTGFSSRSDLDKPAAMYGSAYGTKSLQIIDNTDVLLPSRPWIHDMMITERFILLLCGSIVSLASTPGIPNGNLFKFDKDVKFEIGVASKDDAEFVVGTSHTIKHQESKNLQWFRGFDSAAIMHVANAWEEVDQKNDTIIILWAPMSTSQNFNGNFSKTDNSFYMARVALNLVTGQMRRGSLGTDYSIDYPVVHPAYRGYRSKYIFASILDNEWSTRDNDNEPIGIIKYNVFDKTIEHTVYFADGVFSGEMVPLPKNMTTHDLSDESTDGSDRLYLVSFIFNSNTHTTEWHIYDGETMNPLPVAVYSVPARVPYGSHGDWIKEEVLQSIINDY